MSRSPSARLRGAATVVTLLVGTWPLQSQDRPAPPPVRNTATDTLEAARDEIQGLEVGREARNLSGEGLPRIAAPGWHGGAAPTPPAPPARPNPAPNARNPNWLLDALQQPDAADGLARDREDARSGGPDARAASDRSDSRRRRTGLTPADSRTASERSATDQAQRSAAASTNPLTTYLDDWMTPRDLALLKPGLGAAPADVLTPPDSGQTPTGFMAGMQSAPGHHQWAIPAPVAPTAGGLGAVSENPFLAALNAPATRVTAATPPPRVTLPAPVPAAAATPAFTPPSASPPPPRIPDFARPATDEKHFKPLKRF